MLYGLGVMMVLLSTVVCGGSAVIPLCIAGAGAVLMVVGGDFDETE